MDLNTGLMERLMKRSKSSNTVPMNTSVVISSSNIRTENETSPSKQGTSQGQITSPSRPSLAETSVILIPDTPSPVFARYANKRQLDPEDDQDSFTKRRKLISSTSATGLTGWIRKPFTGTMKMNKHQSNLSQEKEKFYPENNQIPPVTLEADGPAISLSPVKTSNGLSLPGSPEFLEERRKAIFKKKMKDRYKAKEVKVKLSPLKREHCRSSPFDQVPNNKRSTKSPPNIFSPSAPSQTMSASSVLEKIQKVKSELQIQNELLQETRRSKLALTKKKLNPERDNDRSDKDSKQNALELLKKTRMKKAEKEYSLKEYISGTTSPMCEFNTRHSLSDRSQSPEIASHSRHSPASSSPSLLNVSSSGCTQSNPSTSPVFSFKSSRVSPMVDSVPRCATSNQLLSPVIASKPKCETDTRMNSSLDLDIGSSPELPSLQPKQQKSKVKKPTRRPAWLGWPSDSESDAGSSSDLESVPLRDILNSDLSPPRNRVPVCPKLHNEESSKCSHKLNERSSGTLSKQTNGSSDQLKIFDTKFKNILEVRDKSVVKSHKTDKDVVKRNNSQYAVGFQSAAEVHRLSKGNHSDSLMKGRASGGNSEDPAHSNSADSTRKSLFGSSETSDYKNSKVRSSASASTSEKRTNTGTLIRNSIISANQGTSLNSIFTQSDTDRLSKHKMSPTKVKHHLSKDSSPLKMVLKRSPQGGFQVTSPVRRKPTSSQTVREITDTRPHRAGRKIADKDVVGSADNPVLLDGSTTPRTVRAIQQLERDEEVARKMQEELDMEFAMTLQQQENHSPETGAATGYGHESAGSFTGTRVTYNPTEENIHHWHMHSPPRAMARSRRRRRAAPSEEMIEPLLDTHSFSTAEFLQHLLNQPFPGRGQQRRRRNVFGGSLFQSPNGEGNDYESLMNLAEVIGDAKEKGLSKSDSTRLPIRTFVVAEAGADRQTECMICMCDYENGDSLKILPCFHEFHMTCIDKWITKNATCPVCRVQVKIS